ncbi:MAG: SDR family NAD(P)-dependent oxidoreductase [Alphaproteobacteria bacterium]
MATGEFEGKVVLITGAGRGIGRGTAEAFAKAGAHVGVADLVEDRAAEVAAAITRANGSALALAGDVRREKEVFAMVAKLVDAFGRVDVLANMAGAFSTSFTPSHLITEEEWDLIVDSNLKGSFFGCKAVIPHMLAQGGGRIVNFSSNAGRTVGPVMGCHYTAAKAGVLGLTRHFAKEYAKHNILVNTVAPGPTRGERNQELLKPGVAESLTAQIPLGRMAEPDDMSGVVMFLASDAARFITGATLDVNGGYVMV